MGRIDHYKAQLARLADPRALPAGPALEAVLGDAKPIYYLNAGLHSPEMGSPEMVMGHYIYHVPDHSRPHFDEAFQPISLKNSQNSHFSSSPHTNSASRPHIAEFWLIYGQYAWLSPQNTIFRKSSTGLIK